MKNHIDAIAQELFAEKSSAKKEFLEYLFEAAITQDKTNMISELLSQFKSEGISDKHISDLITHFFTSTKSKNSTSVSLLSFYLQYQSNSELSSLYQSAPNDKVKELCYKILFEGSAKLKNLPLLDKGIELIENYQNKKISAADFRLKIKEFLNDPIRKDLINFGSTKETASYHNNWGKTASMIDTYNIVERQEIKAKIKLFEEKTKSLYQDAQAVLEIGDFQKNSPLVAIDHLNSRDTQKFISGITLEQTTELLHSPHNEKKHYHALLSKVLGGDKPFTSYSPYNESGGKNKEKITFFLERLDNIMVKNPDLWEKYSLIFMRASMESLFKITGTQKPKDSYPNLLEALKTITNQVVLGTKKGKALQLSINVELEKRILSQNISATHTNASLKQSFKI